MLRAFQLVLITTVMLPGIAFGDMTAATERAKSGAFDATGKVSCAQEIGQTLRTCSAAVSRAGGAAAVIVTFPNGFRRTLIFLDRAFVRGNATMSGVGTDTDWRLSQGMYHIRVDDQRFELAEALVFGG